MTSLTRITIFMEGSGRGSRRHLRLGMAAFLQPLAQAARGKALPLNVVPCGSRGNTFRGFRDTVNSADPQERPIPLIDSEALVTLPARAHLRKTDGWDLSFALQHTFHLMVQVMETWILADPYALAECYGQNFNVGRLPKLADLEQEPKTRVKKALNDASKRTGKGVDDKTKHASELLKLLNQERVKDRCRHCKRFFEATERIIKAA